MTFLDYLAAPKYRTLACILLATIVLYCGVQYDNLNPVDSNLNLVNFVTGGYTACILLLMCHGAVKTSMYESLKLPILVYAAINYFNASIGLGTTENSMLLNFGFHMVLLMSCTIMALGFVIGACIVLYAISTYWIK